MSEPTPPTTPIILDVILIPRDTLPAPLLGLCWDYVQTSLATLPGASVQIRQIEPPPACLCCLPMEVDGVPTVVEVSDYLFLCPRHRAMPLYLKWHCTPAHAPLPNVGSFPPASFCDWEEYWKLSTVQPPAKPETIIYRQYIPPEDPSRPIDEQVRRRRLAVQETLLKAFDNLIDSEPCSLPEYFRRALGCLVSVHAPGSWGHLLGRGQWQAMALGACTVSPDIWTAPLGERPVPWEHYVPVRDDYADLVARVRWCQANRNECRAIGRRAKEFFVSHGTPEAIWAYVKRSAQKSGGPVNRPQPWA